MKKNIKWFVAILLLCLSGCGQQTRQETSYINDIKTTEATGTEENKDSLENQIQIFAEQSSLWKAPADNTLEVYLYAVTDLDQNGRLELISTLCQGTGQYTYSTFYEINGAFNGMDSCERTLAGWESEADIAVDSVPVFYDAGENLYYYIFNDFIKNGAARYYRNKRAVFLNNGVIEENFLAFHSAEYQDTATAASRYFRLGEEKETVEISDEEYLNIEDAVYAGLERKTAQIAWFSLYEKENISKEKLADMLTESLEGFKIK